MFHVWYNFNIKVTTNSWYEKGVKGSARMILCALLSFNFDVLKHIHNLNDLCIMQYKSIPKAFFLNTCI